MNKTEILWNPQVKLIMTDVDDTLAAVYTPATPGMIKGLSSLLDQGLAIFMITGGGLQSVMQRVVEQIEHPLRGNILIAPCSGAEVWGFEQSGHLKTEPYYSLYSKLTDYQKTQWRELVDQLVADYKLHAVEPLPIAQFKAQYGGQPKTIMLADRGPQITLELPNGYDLEESIAKQLGVESDENGRFDLRKHMLQDAQQRLDKSELPLKIGLGGDYAFDFIIQGVSKGDALAFALKNEHILHSVGLSAADVHNPHHIEIWGDKFANLGGDYQMYLGIPESIRKQVRAIDFRKSETTNLPAGFNIVLWNGEKEFSEGTEEYLHERSLR